jgi:hypothetical protein
MRRLAIVIVILLLLTGISPVSAKGVVDKVTLSGSLWYGDVEITEPAMLERLALGVFTNFEKEIDGPPLLSSGLLMMRSYQDDGSYQLLDRLLYFPGEAPGEGVVYYVGLANGASPFDGTWYQVRPDSEEMLLGWLSDEGILPSSASFRLVPPRETNQAPTLMLIGVVLSAGLAIGFVFGRRWKVLFH